MDNPLLDQNLLPAFGNIRVEHIEPAIDYLLQDNRETITALLQATRVYTWDNFLQPLEEKEDRLNRAWSTVNHLHSVVDSDELRPVYNSCLQKVTEFASEMGQNEALFLAYKQIADSDDFSDLDYAQKKTIDNALREFRLSGIDLDKAEQNRFREIQQELSALQSKFEENLLDATQAWTKLIIDPEKLHGLPDSVLSLAAQTAQDKQKQGWLFTLDIPSYLPVMQYADDRELRREMYQAYVTRASDQAPVTGDFDNSDVMVKILSLRMEMAGLLGYDSYAEYSLARKMAVNTDEVFDFLNDLANRSRSVAGTELRQLQEFSRDNFSIDELQAWDIAYFSEKLKQHEFHFSQEELRPYFPVAGVIEGMFAVVGRLYGLSFREKKGIDTWHPDVLFFEIYDKEEELRGSFFLDLYARPHKRGGAWMGDCVVRIKNNDSVQKPTAFITCNFTPPVAPEPSLLTHDEVQTLFHEFGHGLHHMLTRIDYPGVSGINGVPWDAVELPSQFMENWCWQKEALHLIAGHYLTGDSLTEELFDRMQRAKTFQAGLQMVRQLEFALFDFHLHYDYRDQGIDEVQAMLNKIRARVAVIIPPGYNRFQHGFSHIFAGGYAAGYYSYKWAEVLSADAFSRFKENDIFNREIGAQFLHTILEQGGAKEPMELFIEFRGRKPKIDALLHHAGILEQKTGVTA